MLGLGRFARGRKRWLPGEQPRKGDLRLTAPIRSQLPDTEKKEQSIGSGRGRKSKGGRASQILVYGRGQAKNEQHVSGNKATDPGIKTEIRVVGN